jgi:hypothetical protein
MAEVDTVQLSQEHGAIRHDIAVESGDIRREGSEHASEIRYDVATRAGDIRHETADGFGQTRYNIAERAGDIRRELADVKDVLNDSIRVEGGETRTVSAAQTGAIIQEGLKGDFNTRGDIKDTRYDLADRVGNSADRIVDRLTEHDRLVAERFWTVGRDTQELRAQVTAAQQQMVAGFMGVSKDTELAALKTQLDAKANTQYLNDKITVDGEKTRALINDLKYHDLNRSLVERQTELVNCEQDRRRAYDRWDDARFSQLQNQWAAQSAMLQNQVQAFQSQLQETRQGMVNFGTMAGVGQTSTSNNVR